MTSLKKIVEKILQPAGITINGNQPWDIQVNNEKFYARALHDGTLGLGEAYMDGWWDCERVDQLFAKFVRAKLADKVTLSKWQLIKIWLPSFINYQTRKRALEVGKQHYDLGNDLFIAMLDRRMNYTCGYWQGA